ncbi:zinc finger protein 3 homolog isoform X2 [Eurosta solidaginis]|uniref:zinc finger protein 3 homolog isoform X2 n=1 Tax=Eurosta solidaginis TaxID=178769 RepID=UPI0035308091
MKLTNVVPKSCRVCLKRAAKLRSLYKPLDEGEEPPNEMLRLIAGVELETPDIYETLPKCICKSCELSLSMAYQFREKVIRTHQIIERPNAVKEELVEVITPNDFNDENALNDGHNREMKEETLELSITEIDILDTDNNEEEMLEINIEEDMEEECKPEYLYEEEYFNNGDTSRSPTTFPEDEKDATEDGVIYNYELEIAHSNEDVKEIAVEENSPEQDRAQKEPAKEFPEFEQKIQLSTTASEKNNTAHICDICGNIYAKRGRMMEHRRRHDKELRFACELCDKRFHLREKLRKHMFLHTGGKPYKCSFCSRTFFYESVRKAHEAVHSGIKPYVCDECNKAFAYAHALAKHKLIHADIKLYHCEYCGKDFRLQHHMKQHVYTKLHQNAVYAAKLKLKKEK